MAIQSKTTLKGYFDDGDRPTSSNFQDLVDSFIQAPLLQDCAANPNYPIAKAGDIYRVSVAGKIGGTSGISVSVGDLFVATEDNAGGTHASVGDKWTVIGNKSTGGSVGLPSLTSNSVLFWNGGTFAEDNANFNYSSNQLRLQGSAGSTVTPLALRNNAVAAVNNSVAIAFAANRTTGGMTNLGGIRCAITNIGNTTYASFVSLMATPTNGSPTDVLIATAVVSSMNFWIFRSAASGSPVTVTTDSNAGDANIGLSFIAKGAGNILLQTSGNTFVGGSTTPTAKLDIAAAVAGAASLRIRQGTAPSTPNVGDFWLETTNNRIKHRKNSTTTTDLLAIHDNFDLVGTGSRMLQTDSAGNLSAIDTIVELFTSDPTIQSSLTTISNWNQLGVYGGSSIANAYQGLFHSDSDWLYLFRNTTTPIRLPRHGAPVLAKVATTDATTTTLYTLAIPASNTVGVHAFVTARRTGGTAGTAEDAAFYEIKAVYKNVAGTATLVGSATITPIGEDQAGWDVSLSVSSGNVLVRVTGATDNTVSWRISLNTHNISS